MTFFFHLTCRHLGSGGNGHIHYGQIITRNTIKAFFFLLCIDIKKLTLHGCSFEKKPQISFIVCGVVKVNVSERQVQGSS